MNCTECGTKCVKTDPGVHECPDCCNVFTTKKHRANEERHVASMPVDQWLQHVGFSPEQIATMKAESKFADKGGAK